MREFTELPAEAPALDERQLATTLGLWHFDKLNGGKSPDECKRKLDAFAEAPPVASAPKTEQNHWGKEQVDSTGPRRTRSMVAGRNLRSVAGWRASCRSRMAR